MSLKFDDQDNLFGAHVTMSHLLSDDDPMVVFSKEIFPLFIDKDFEDCYSDRGRGAVSPALLAMVTLLQYRENLSDREAAEACVKRIDWKIALHLPLEANDIFHHSLLTRFRNRLKENDKSSLIFDKIVDIVKKKGFVRRNTNQRIDATHIISHVNRISTTDLLFRTVKSVMREIENKHKNIYQEYMPEYLKQKYENRFSSFGMSKEKKQLKLEEIIHDGIYIKSIIEKRTGESLNQIKIMETIFQENVIIHKKPHSNEILKVEEIKSPQQTIFDPDDLSISLGIKGKINWVGSKCHVVETAMKGEMNFITGMLYQSANENDQMIHDKLRESNDVRKLKPYKIYTDGNYISGKSICNYKRNNQLLLGRISMDTSRKNDAFRLDRFNVDLVKMKITCPVGKESEKYTLVKKGLFDFYFKKEDCQKCKYFTICVEAKTHSKRRVQVSPYYDYIKQRRKEQKTKNFRKEMSVRAQIEGTISEMKRKLGLRYAKYHGKDGHQLQFYLTGAALNVKRLLRVLV